ncbi:MAG: aminotransferase class V-fold PLP-dependent enzyme [Candidatus Kapabacteria bacterium]|nr:aminotransferase class V-fold PLP-dependent enzyme [Candidatus Kapabacteria bacterium]
MLQRSDFLLCEDIIFLNHGSFGACPRVILDEQRTWIDRLEYQPVLFFREAPALLKSAREALSHYVGAQPQDLVYVTNSTYGINVAAHAFAELLAAGDEIVTTDHEYGACDRAWHQYCVNKGIKYVRAEIPIPVPSTDELVEIIWNRVTPKTKVLFLSHITSPTAVRLPIEELCIRAKAAGIRTVVDGSHAPGHILLDLSTLQADVYTANCHKWMCTPKGSAFLWVAPDIQQHFTPLIVSWGSEIPTAGDGLFMDEHEYIGTRDLSPFLTVPFALKWMEEQRWDVVQQNARALATYASEVLTKLKGVAPLCTTGQDAMLQMAAVTLPDSTDTDVMKDWLYNERAIEVVVHRWLGKAILRCSTHAHTSRADVDTLAVAVNDYLADRT